MFALGVVGPEQNKFTAETEARARAIIREEIALFGATTIISGHCPLGGVDIYAEEIAAELGLPTRIFAPRQRCWDGEYGFKARNLDIARHSDLVLCIVLAHSAMAAGGKDWGGGICYHCARNTTDFQPHVKSGGCWTAWKCVRHKWRLIE